MFIFEYVDVYLYEPRRADVFIYFCIYIYIYTYMIIKILSVALALMLGFCFSKLCRYLCANAY